MKVSIVTTCLNRVDTIEETLKSISRQSYPDVEHIIVDGASTDGTVELVRRSDSSRISYFISEKDRGAYEALNKGIRLASGEIVGWLHSDDIYYNDHVLQDVVALFERTGCDVVFGDGLFVHPLNPKWVIRDWKSGDFEQDKLQKGWLPLHTAMFVRRSLFEQYGFYCEDYKISSDTDWMLRLLSHHKDLHVEYFPFYLVIMRYGGLSTSLFYMLRKWREDLGIYKRFGFSPKKSLLRKVVRKIPQYLQGPFVKLPFLMCVPVCWIDTACSVII